MSKKAKSKSALGRALINDRFKKSTARRSKDPSILHSSEVPDGYEWGRLNLKSVTEESSFQEFLSTAQLAGTEFQTEKLNITFVNPLVGVGLLTKEEKEKVEETQEENKHFLSIPRRPKWDETTTPEKLEAAENDEFLEWRRRLAVLQEKKEIILTPYEKNLEFWRQLWRVVERSDVTVQIVDARNPLLFRCKDLESYVQEVSPHKQNLILLNKADYLTDAQRTAWADYFGHQGVRVAFYSATEALEVDPEEDIDVDKGNEGKGSELPLDTALADLEIGSKEDGESTSDLEASDATDEITKQKQKEEESCTVSNEDNKHTIEEPAVENIAASSSVGTESQTSESQREINEVCVTNSDKLLSRSELISLFYAMHGGEKVTSGVTTIGLVGYPNVGKSSTINSLLLEKKVSVSATPGKTKHFQTLFLDKDLLLCDCPGLVMPSFVYSKAEMVVNGILSIDQMRDHVPPVNLVASLIPRHVLEDTYGIMIPPPREGEDPSRPPTSEELLNTYGYNRGFMTQNGQPDNPRAARHVLKDFVCGKLLYCWAPPGCSHEKFHTFPERRKAVNRMQPIKKILGTSADLDKAFFKKPSSGAHAKGLRPVSTVSPKQGSTGSKPWRDHSDKRNKREKLRRVYAHLDQ